ncbi:MAG TPA: PAS domain S-box protein [Pyrinomonadaceae bacterium]
MGISSNKISGKTRQGSAGYLTSDRRKDDSRNRNQSFIGGRNAPERLRDTVLIVNDVQDQLDLMGTFLGQSGYHVITAQDGCEGYEVALAERPDLIISDVSMPRMNGIEMCSLIRENAELKRTPILLVSAVRKDSESAVQGLKAGADDYLEAPYDPMLLVARVAYLIERKRADQTRLLLAAIVESSDDAIIGKTLGGQITSWNAGAEAMYGYTAEEAIGQQISLIFPAASASELAVIHERIRRGESIKHLETVGVCKDGASIQVSVSVSPIKDDAGQLVGASTIARDITERKRVTEALRESEHRFRAYIENASDNITIIAVDGTTVYESPSVARLTGYEPEELVGSHAFAHIHPDDLEKVTALLAPKIISQATVGPVEYRYIHKNGSLLTFESIGKSHLDEKGELVSIVNTRDITERKRMEEALRQSEERYRRLFENANDIIYTQDLAGNFTSVNKVAEAVTGYSLEEVLKMNFSQLFSAADIEKMRMMTKRKLSRQTDSTSYEVTFRAKDGRAVQLDVSTTLIIENGVPVGVQGIARDITERKRAEAALRTSQAQLQQSQKLEAIGQLAGGVAHDFNNLLTAIKGYSDLSLRRLHEDHPVRGHLEEIKKASDRAASLTRQLLAFSRKQILEPKVLDLNLVVRDMYDMLRRLIGEDIDLATNLKSDLGRVKADPGQVEQIIMNLVVNARDAMVQGGKVTIETSNVTFDERYTLQHAPVETGNYVMLAVTDTGCGMDKETQTHMFEPFFTTKEAGKGTGLGLSTVYGIVTQSGGYIWVYSEVGKGTSFKVYLPRLAEQTLPEKSKSVSPDAELGGHKTILLVEDEAIVRHITCLILESKGYRVLEAEGAEEALHLCRLHAGKIDLMLTDVIMPGMSGRVLAERVAVSCPELPVLYMSGYTDDAIVRHGLLADMLEFIQKPFTPEALTLKVRSVLDTHARKTGKADKASRATNSLG